MKFSTRIALSLIPLLGTTLQATDWCAICTIPARGDQPADRRIESYQRKIAAAEDPSDWFERLGWAYIERARERADPGDYVLADATARCLESKAPGHRGAARLRARVAIHAHRFADAEREARRLTATGNAWFDHALLGDALMEQGQLDAAVESYDRMIEARPSPAAYARVAHVRWLRGDLAGAASLLQRAATSAGSSGPAAAWIRTRWARILLQAGAVEEAAVLLDSALGMHPASAEASYLRSLVAYSADDIGLAVDSARRAAQLSALPEHLWLCADLERIATDEREASRIERDLMVSGDRLDPRSQSLFLATRGLQTSRALRLSTSELASRHDVFTHDAIAWSLLAEGRADEAWSAIRKALAEGTVDARLFLHAGIIARRRGNTAKARALLDDAHRVRCTLHPSERSRLARELRILAIDPSAISAREEGGGATSE